MNAVVPLTHTNPVSITTHRGLQLNTFDDMARFAKAIAASGMSPLKTPEACLVAMQLGLEVGLSPMASVQNIAVINGRPGLFGPAMLAVVEASGKLAAISETIEGTGDARKAVCTVQRVGRQPVPFTFSVDDAKKAGLWGKSGPWQQYPDRMLKARAKSFALRDVFPDVLLGLAMSAEELEDIPVRDITPSAPVPTQAQETAGAGSGTPPQRAPAPATNGEAAAKQWVEQQRPVIESLMDAREIREWVEASEEYILRLEKYPNVKAYLDALIAEREGAVS